MEFRDKMRALLVKKGITQKEFAAAAEMNYAHANRFFIDRAPSMDFIQKVVQVFPEVDLNWLLLSHPEHRTVDRVQEVDVTYNKEEALDYVTVIEEKVLELKQLLTQS